MQTPSQHSSDDIRYSVESPRGMRWRARGTVGDTMFQNIDARTCENIGSSDWLRETKSGFQFYLKGQPKQVLFTGSRHVLATSGPPKSNIVNKLE